MKKFLSLALALAMALSLFACDQPAANPTTPPDKTAAPETPSDAPGGYEGLEGMLRALGADVERREA